MVNYIPYKSDGVIYTDFGIVYTCPIENLDVPRSYTSVSGGTSGATAEGTGKSGTTSIDTKTENGLSGATATSTNISDSQVENNDNDDAEGAPEKDSICVQIDTFSTVLSTIYIILTVLLTMLILRFT